MRALFLIAVLRADVTDMVIGSKRYSRKRRNLSLHPCRLELASLSRESILPYLFEPTIGALHFTLSTIQTNCLVTGRRLHESHSKQSSCAKVDLSPPADLRHSKSNILVSINLDKHGAQGAFN